VLDIASSQVLQPEPIPYGTWWRTDSTGPINRFSIEQVREARSIAGRAWLGRERARVDQQSRCRNQSREQHTHLRIPHGKGHGL
jgi:hypothetical protein